MARGRARPPDAGTRRERADGQARLSDQPILRFFAENVRALAALAFAHQYVLLFLIVAIEEAGLPLPAPSDLVIAYYGDRARGDLWELAAVVLISAAASTAGTLVPYLVTRRWGDAAARWIARWLDVDPARVSEWETRIARNGFLAVFVGRLIPGLRVTMSLVAGTARVRPHEFAAGVFCAASVYWSGWAAVGVVFGPAFRRIVGPAYVRYVVIGLPVLFVALLVARRLRARRRAG